MKSPQPVNIQPNEASVTKGKTANSALQTLLTSLLCAFFLVFATGAYASKTDKSEIKATATASRTTVGVAEPVEVTIEVIAPEGVTVRFPEISEKVGSFEITGHRDTLDVPSKQGRKFIRKLSLESLQAGELTIPEFEVYFADRRGEKTEFATAKTQSIPITVQTSITEADQPTHFRDLKNVVFLEEPTNPKSIPWGFWSIVSGTSFFGIVGFILIGRFWKRLSPKQRALRDLDQLSQAESLSRGDSKLVYEETTRILRTFIEVQFDLPATRQTTGEFLLAVQSDHRIDDSLRERLERFLESADIVKFAGLSCPTEVLREAINKARQFVLRADELRMASLKQSHKTSERQEATHQKKETN